MLTGCGRRQDGQGDQVLLSSFTVITAVTVGNAGASDATVVMPIAKKVSYTAHHAPAGYLGDHVQHVEDKAAREP